MSKRYTKHGYVHDEFVISDSESDSYEYMMDQPSSGYIYIAQASKYIYLISWCKFIEHKLKEHDFIPDTIVYFACDDPQSKIFHVWDKMDEMGYRNPDSNRAYWRINTELGYEQVLQFMQKYAMY